MSGYVYRLTRVASLQDGAWERDSISSWVTKVTLQRGHTQKNHSGHLATYLLQLHTQEVMAKRIWHLWFAAKDPTKILVSNRWNQSYKSDHHWRSTTGMWKSHTWMSLLLCTCETFKTEAKLWEHWPCSVIFLQFYVWLEWDKELEFTKASWLLQCSLAVWCNYCLPYVRVLLSTLFSHWILTLLLFLCLREETLGSCTSQNN